MRTEPEFPSTLSESHGSALAADPLSTVSTLARDLAGRFELAPLLERILGHATSLLGCESGSISLVDESRGTYTKQIDFGVGCQEGETFSLSEGVTGHVVRARKTEMFAQYSIVGSSHISFDDPRWDCAVIGVPIFWDDKIVGTCVIFAADGARVFTEEDAKLAEVFANHAAIALANAELHAKASERERESAIATERERAVREVHETIGRSLGELLQRLDDVTSCLEADSPAASHIHAVRTIAHDTLVETRRTAQGLGPASLEGRSLESALQAELGWVESMTAAQTQLTVIGGARDTGPEVAHQLFKIAQEALSNVVSHARASTVRVGLVYGEGRTEVLIEDNGRGFDLAEAHGDHSSLPSGCLGLHGMTSRALHLSGELILEPIVGWGTKVHAVIPDRSALPDHVIRPQWKVVIASDQTLITAGLVRVINTNEPAIQVAATVTSTEQLLDAYELFRPDVLLVDLEMVHSDKTGALAAIRELAPEIAIVVLTDNPSVDQIRAAKSAGARGYINSKSTADTIIRILVAASQGQTLMESDMFDHLTGTFELDINSENLTTRELEVREMVALGMADKQIATSLGISAKTVEKHVGSLLRKTGARNRTMLVSMDPTRQVSPPALKV
jgi:DNA-binding NarL/FixJ family response regulator/signal transduction histidine kinase